MNRKNNKKHFFNNKILLVYFLFGIIIFTLILTLILFPGEKPGTKGTAEQNTVSKERTKQQTVEKTKQVTPKKTIQKPVPVKKRVKGKLYFVIDDVGNNIFQLKPFLKLPFKITFAILPGLPYTKKAGEMIHAAGKEYIIHQPMDAVGGEKTGPGAIHIGMKEGTVAAVINANLVDLPFAKGMNNHMGSAGTANEELMVSLFHVLKRRHMFFLDSRTTAATVARKAARETGVLFAERSVFLDNKQEKKAIESSVESGMEISEKKGHAIMIGHVWSSELAEILLELYPTLLEDNYTLNNLTELFMGYKEDEDTWN